MADKVLKVMLSSAVSGLRAYGDVLRDAVRRQGMLPVIAELDAASSRETIADALAMVDGADAYVALIGAHRYGWVTEDEELNPHGLSVPEIEFERAARNGLPICTVLADEGDPAGTPLDDAVARLRTRAERRGLVTVTVATPDALASAAAEALAKLRLLLEKRDDGEVSSPGASLRRTVVQTLDWLTPLLEERLRAVWEAAPLLHTTTIRISAGLRLQMEAWEGAASRARLARLVSEAKRAAFYADLRSQSAGLIDWLRSQAARLNAWGGRWDKRLLRSSAAGGAAVSYAPDPLGPAGKGEPLDRSGRPLPWRWERSLSRDFLGRYGLPLAGAAVALAMLGQLSSAPPLPPKEAAGVPDRRGLIYPAPVQPAPVQPPTPQQQQQQRVPASPKAPAPAEK